MTADFGKLYTLYYKRSLLYVKSYVRDSMVAEDLVSESLLRFWKAIQKEPIQHPATLLIVILRNNTLNYLKHQRIHTCALESMSSTSSRDLHYRIMSLEAFDPADLASNEINAIIDRTLAALPEQTRRVFELSRYEGMPVKDVANALSVSPKSVEYHITKALKSLRIALKDYLPLLLFLFNP